MPSDFTEMLGGAVAPQDQGGTAFRGEITKVGATVNNAIEVVIVGFSNTAKYLVPGDQWIGSVVPTVGTPCLVLLDDTGDAWVLLGT